MSIDVKFNREIFISTFRKYVIDDINHRDSIGAMNILEYLDSTDFFTAPCSTRFHLSVEGGLCQHSINVFTVLYAMNTKMANLTGTVYDKSTIAIVSLLHDICKIETYKKEKRWRKNEQNEWENYDAWVYNEDFAFGHSEKSVFIISSFMNIRLYEAQAINGHMGFSDSRGSQLIGNIFSQNKLAVMLHMADMIATYFMEE